MLAGFYLVLDRFVQPSDQFGEQPPDVAIRELKPEFVAHIGKSPLDLDASKEPPSDVAHALGVGFPESLKYNKNDGTGFHRVVMPQVEVLAELSGRPSRRFTMFSELEQPAPDIDYSGMSGGPIFWAEKNDYGILGIIYEGGAGEENSTIYLFGELATPAVIKGWIEQIRS
jgi:hypothetical protein